MVSDLCVLLAVFKTFFLKKLPRKVTDGYGQDVNSYDLWVFSTDRNKKASPSNLPANSCIFLDLVLSKEQVHRDLRDSMLLSLI